MKLTNGQKKILVIAGDRHACGEFRIQIPYSRLITKNNSEFEFYNWDIEFRPQVTFPELMMFDAVLFQRPHLPNQFEVMKQLQKHGKKVVVEIDDLLDSVHRDNIASTVFHAKAPALVNFLNCLEICDGVTTSTPELAERYRLKNKKRNVHVALNCLDLNNEIYKQRPKNLDYPEGQINIMWSGSTSHHDSIKFLRGIIEPVIMDYGDNVKFVLGGNKEFMDLIALPDDRKIFIPGVPLKEYPILPSHAHIFLTPVLQSPFNDAKSELKILEAGIWGIPSISSDVAPYRRFNKVSNGANLVAKNNRPAAWQKHLRTLIDDEALRLKLGQQTKDVTCNVYYLDIENEKRLEFWRNLFKD